MKTNEQLKLLIDLYGGRLMRVPMMLFVWGTSLVFVLFVFEMARSANMIWEK